MIRLKQKSTIDTRASDLEIGTWFLNRLNVLCVVFNDSGCKRVMYIKHNTYHATNASVNDISVERVVDPSELEFYNTALGVPHDSSQTKNSC